MERQQTDAGKYEYMSITVQHAKEGFRALAVKYF